MSHDGRAVANFVLDFCDQRNREVTHLSLQKIVYFCHVWSLIELGRPLIRHQFESWEHGPVLQYLYREFRPFGIVLAFPTERVLGILSEEGREDSYYLELASQFVHFIFIQVMALIIALAASAYPWLVLSFVGVLLLLYAVFTAAAIGLSLFGIAQIYNHPGANRPDE